MSEYKVASSQKVQINVLDADTKQLIREDFYISHGHLFMGEGSSRPMPLICEMMDHGISYTTFGQYELLPDYGDRQKTIEFVESQVTALGYDYNSITGNVINLIHDPKTDMYFYPWIVNVYMSKL